MKPQSRRTSARSLQRVLYDLALDWLHLNAAMPQPTGGGGGGRTSNMKVYGHPAEWASDQCARIADLLWGWHDLVAEVRAERRPLPVAIAGRRGEQRAVVAAWRYLEPRLEWILEQGQWCPASEVPVPWREYYDWLVADEALDELWSLHREIRARTGGNKARYMLPIPCPNSDCGLRTLERSAGMRGQDWIVCGACGYTAKDSHYDFLVRVMLETLPDAQATRE
ncbi:hypothetical protein GYA93_17805 [Gordonia desulfuricans]|uniref:Uncharacterized protein n=1 Tax=Gordonia desulfuricans TaxID=89051 RepID=A0A7K3LT37_9ACTN|nr:hypothetical protein [Gordonia desulfuricans]NDK91418.1 hypothetical protein [Gordonia desulfuricans]